MSLKPSGTSHTISQEARREAGWTEMNDLAALHAHLNPTISTTGGAHVVA